MNYTCAFRLENLTTGQIDTVRATDEQMALDHINEIRERDDRETNYKCSYVCTNLLTQKVLYTITRS